MNFRYKSELFPTLSEIHNLRFRASTDSQRNCTGSWNWRTKLTVQLNNYANSLKFTRSYPYLNGTKTVDLPFGWSRNHSVRSGSSQGLLQNPSRLGRLLWWKGRRRASQKMGRTRRRKLDIVVVDEPQIIFGVWVWRKAFFGNAARCELSLDRGLKYRKNHA